MKKSLYKLSVISLVLLSACSSSNQQIATPTVYLVPTATVLSTKIPVQATKTAAPTATVIIGTPTTDYGALLSRLLPNCGNAELSPSQTWAIGFCNNDETWIVDVNQTAKWTISYGEYYGKRFDSGNGVIAPFYWTSDSKNLYLTVQRGVSGPIYFANGWELINLDLASGKIAEILRPLPRQYYSFSLSSDGKLLAYILQPTTSLVVIVMNLESKDVKSYSLKPEYNQAGAMLWSPDMSKIVLGQAIVDYDGVNPDVFSVVMLDLANDSLETVVSDNLVETRPQKWVDENTIELSDSDGKFWIYSLIDKTLSEKKQ